MFLVRAWLEGEPPHRALRARITSTVEADPPTAPAEQAVGSAEEIAAALQAWLEALSAR